MSNFRFGSRSVPGQHAASPGRVHGIVPNNAGISHAAQDRVDLLTSAASRRAKEAISGIDAVQLYIWEPLKHGPACGCGTAAKSPDPAVPNNPYVLGMVEDDRDNVDDLKPVLRVKSYDVTPYDFHVMQSNKDEPDHRFSEADVLGDMVIPPKTSTKGTTDPYASKTDANNGPYEGPMHGSGSIYLHEGEYDHERPDSLGDIYGEELISEYDDEGWNPDSILADSAYVLGSMLSTCPVCFGTGILGGYSLWGATRIVLSSVNATGGSNTGAESDNSAPVYTLAPHDTVEWAVTNCPNYFTFGWANARNLKKSTNATITYTIDNGATWKNLTTIGDDSAVNLSSMRIRATNNTNADVSLSHVDLTVFHNVVLGQVSNFNPIAGSSAIIKGDGLIITLPPEVGIISRNALIGDNKYYLMWRVTNLETISTSKMQVISCTASTELMEPSLVETTLFPFYSIDGQAQKLYGAGIEPVQGMR